MVTQFNSRNSQIGTVVRDNWNIIQNTEELTQIFNTKSLMGYRRLPNLKDLLTSSTISYPRNIKPDTKKVILYPCLYKIRETDQITEDILCP